MLNKLSLTNGLGTIMAVSTAVIVLFLSCNHPERKFPDYLNLEVLEYGYGQRTPGQNDVVRLKLTYSLKDSLLFSQTGQDSTLIFPMHAPLFKADLYEALSYLMEGDSARLTVPADSFFFHLYKNHYLPPGINDADSLQYHIRLINLYTRAEFDSVHELEVLQNQMQEKEKIGAWLEKNQYQATEFPSGLLIITESQGTGKLPDTGDMCQIFMTVRTIDGDSLFSNEDDWPFDIEFGKKFDNAGFMEGLSHLHEGESARLIVPSVIGVGSEGYDGVPGYTTLDYQVRFIKIRPLDSVKADRAARKQIKQQQLLEQKENEALLINQFVDKFNVAGNPSPSGLYCNWIESGSGREVIKGDLLTITYERLSDDYSTVESSLELKNPVRFRLGIDPVLRGWEEALYQMKVGDRCLLVIPSASGFGRQGRGKDIPPYSPLFYEITLVDAKASGN